MTHERTIKHEAGGTTVECTCGRLWWCKTQADAEGYWRRHLPKSKEGES